MNFQSGNSKKGLHFPLFKHGISMEMNEISWNINEMSMKINEVSMEIHELSEREFKKRPAFPLVLA